MKRRESATVVLALALVALVFAAACSKSTNSTNTTNTSNSGKTTTGTGTTTSMSPTEVFNAYFDAAIKKDYVTAKKYLSQGTLRLMEDEAKKQGKTLDQALQESAAAQGEAGERPKLSNEKISGDTATVDVTAEGKTASMPFVKEGGEWKIAMDKFLEGMLNDLRNSNPKEGGDQGEADDSDNDNHNH